MYVAPMIATRRERETHFGANDRAMVMMPIYFVCIALSQQKKCDNCNTMLKNVVTIAYRNIYYYKRICYNNENAKNKNVREKNERD